MDGGRLRSPELRNGRSPAKAAFVARKGGSKTRSAHSFGVTWGRVVLIVLATVTVGASAVAVVPSDARVSASGVSVAVLTVGPTPVGAPIAPGFVGLSMEYPTLATYAGRNPRAVDPVLEQLIRNLAPQRPVLRIGGSTTDWTWWPIA